MSFASSFLLYVFLTSLNNPSCTISISLPPIIFLVYNSLAKAEFIATLKKYKMCHSALGSILESTKAEDAFSELLLSA
jgi:hypothetical protein